MIWFLFSYKCFPKSRQVKFDQSIIYFFLSCTMPLKVKVAQSCPTLQSHWLEPDRRLCPWNSPGKNTGVDCQFLLQKIFLTQGLNLGFLHCRQIFTIWATREDIYILWHFKSKFMKKLHSYSHWFIFMSFHQDHLWFYNILSESDNLLMHLTKIY